MKYKILYILLVMLACNCVSYDELDIMPFGEFLDAYVSDEMPAKKEQAFYFEEEPRAGAFVDFAASDFSQSAIASEAQEHNSLRPTLFFDPQIEETVLWSVYESAPDRIHVLCNRLRTCINPLCMPKRLLLHGPAGSGKTTLAVAMAVYTGREYHVVHAPAVGDEYQNSGAQDMVELAHYVARIFEPTVIIIDEITSITRDYGEKHNYESKTTEALWLAIDACEQNPNVFLVATTNYLDKLPAQIRDRFRGATVEIKEPALEQRIKLIYSYLPHGHECTQSDIAYVARWTTSLSARELKACIVEALACAEDEGVAVARRHLDSSLAHHKVSTSWLTWWMPRDSLTKEQRTYIWDIAVFVVPNFFSAINLCGFFYQLYQTQRMHNESTSLNSLQARVALEHGRLLHDESLAWQKHAHNESTSLSNAQARTGLEQARLLHDDSMKFNAGQARMQWAMHQMSQEQAREQHRESLDQQTNFHKESISLQKHQAFWGFVPYAGGTVGLASNYVSQWWYGDPKAKQQNTALEQKKLLELEDKKKK